MFAAGHWLLVSGPASSHQPEVRSLTSETYQFLTPSVPAAILDCLKLRIFDSEFPQPCRQNRRTDHQRF